MRALWKKLGSFLWWAYPRGSVEYDIMVGLILVFIFLTPRTFFRDQQRPFVARTAAVTLISANAAQGHLYEVLGAGPHPDLPALLKKYLGHPVHIRNVQTLHGPDSTTAIYNVWTD